tara:strand:+ start:343 stop:537 length:195 start_codon:yes stop_codon:yes gene_type:complete
MPGYDPSAYVGMAAEVLKASRKNLAGVKGRLDADVQTIVMNDPEYNIMDPSPAQSGTLRKNGRT